MLQQFLPLIPVLTVILSISVFRKSTRTAMLFGSCAALLLILLTGEKPAALLQRLMSLCLGTIRENAVLFITLPILGIYVYTLTESTVIGALSGIVQNASSPLRIFGLLLFSVLLFSADDYLDCIAVCLTLTAPFMSCGISAARFAVFTNLLVNSACVLFPSSWQPVLSAALSGAGMQSVSWKPFTFFPLISLALVAGSLFRAGKTGKHEAENVPEARPKEVFYLLLAALSLSGSNLILRFFNVKEPLLIASVLSLMLLIPLFLKKRLISRGALKESIREGLSTMGNLDITLFFIWIYTGLVTEGLQLNGLVSTIAAKLCGSSAAFIAPAAVFISAALFSYFSSSSFASFRLMVPLAAAAAEALPSRFTPLLLGAAISGSLFASSCISADTLTLAVQSSGADLRNAFRIQSRYTVLLLVLCFIAYLSDGYLVLRGISGVLNLLIPVILSGFSLFFLSMKRAGM